MNQPDRASPDAAIVASSNEPASSPLTYDASELIGRPGGAYAPLGRPT